MPLARRPSWPALLVACVAVASSALTLGNDLVLDDPPLVAYVERLDREGGLRRVLTADFRLWPTAPLGYYRPVVLVSLWLDARAPLPSPWAYHATNVVLHATSSVLVFLVARALVRSAPAALIAGLLFAVHPVHVESIALIAGRTDLWAAVFVLAAALMWARTAGDGRPATPATLIAGGLAVALAALSKEVGFLAPIALAGWCLLRTGGRGHWREAVLAGRPWLLTWAGGALVALAIRWLVADLGGTVSSSAAPADPGLLPGLWARYLRMLAIPWPLNAYYLPEQVALDTVTASAALGVLAVAALCSTRRSAGVGLLALVWMAVFLLPVAAIRPLNAAVFAERYLYLPSAGFCLLAGYVLGRAGGDTFPQSVRVLGAVALVAAAAGLSMVRIREWRDPISFYATLVRTSPRYAGAYEGLGQAMDRRGLRDGAVAAYRQALRIDPGRASAYNSLGALLADEEAFTEAAQLFRRAVKLDPTLAEARLNLGVACLVLHEQSCLIEQLDALREVDPEAALRLQSIAQEARRREQEGRQAR